MFLKALKFYRFKGEPNGWSLEGRPKGNEYNQWLTLTGINLVVGKNASGKSKTITVIRQIADLISGDKKLSDLRYGTSEYQMEFDDNGKKIEYYLSFKDFKVVQETLIVDGSEKLNREQSKLFYEKANDFLSFKTDSGIIALTRRDSEQQPFFESLYQWGKNLNQYNFGSQLGQNMFLRDINAIKVDEETSLKDTNKVAEVFVKGQNRFPDTFLNLIISDMARIAYKIKNITTISIKFISVFGLAVDESDLSDVTDQTEMSQGMFRALSLLIQLNYSILSKSPSCILIDDIGEGLDYERAKNLIDLIIEKVKDTNIQVIMTTNDRFIMNKIPLEFWSVIQRLPGKALFYNYQNSKETFDEFKYSGLSNFDFFETQFFITGFEKEE